MDAEQMESERASSMQRGGLGEVPRNECEPIVKDQTLEKTAARGGEARSSVVAGGGGHGS